MVGLRHCGVAAALGSPAAALRDLLRPTAGFYIGYYALGEGETGGMAVLAFPGWTTRKGVSVSVLSPTCLLVSVLSPTRLRLPDPRCAAALLSAAPGSRDEALWPTSKQRSSLGGYVWGGPLLWPPVRAMTGSLGWPSCAACSFTPHILTSLQSILRRYRLSPLGCHEEFCGHIEHRISNATFTCTCHMSTSENLARDYLPQLKRYHNVY